MEGERMLYDVHVYAVVRVKVEGIEAENQHEAIDKANKRFDPNDIFGAEYADEVTGYLVDEQGDDEHERSEWYPIDALDPSLSI